MTFRRERGKIMSDELNVVKIDDWGIVGSDDPYLAPELRTFQLVGVVTVHRNESINGKHIRTSSIVGSDGKYVVTRSGTRYDIGIPATDYEEQFPNAKERLYARIEELDDNLEANKEE